MRKPTRRLAAVSAGVLVATGVGIAYAAWTSTGSGSGTAKSEAISNVTFAGAATLDKVYPTGASDISLTVSNPNHYNAALSNWAMPAVYNAADPNLANLGVPATPQPTNIKTLCDLTLAPDTGKVVVHDAVNAAYTITDGLHMGNNADNTCANLTYVVSLTADAASTASAANIS